MKQINTWIKQFCDPKRAAACQKYFKASKGDYAQGDKFLGISTPQSRAIAKQFKTIGFDLIQQLLESQYHEKRLIGLFILVQQFKKNSERKAIYDFYLKNLAYVNNWDLVDQSAPTILGAYLLDQQDKEVLYQLARSQVLWQRRISIVSTLTFIRSNQFEHTLNLSSLLLNDNHDLIHKAVGWMLREVGNKKIELLEQFVQKNYKSIPRTTLRYSIEKFEEEKRKKYLKGNFDNIL